MRDLAGRLGPPLPEEVEERVLVRFDHGHWIG
jgi:hypothetical protein